MLTTIFVTNYYEQAQEENNEKDAVATLAALAGCILAPDDLPIDPSTLENQSKSEKEDSNEGSNKESDSGGPDNVGGAAAANGNKGNPDGLFADESFAGENKYQHFWRLSWRKISEYLEGGQVCQQ